MRNKKFIGKFLSIFMTAVMTAGAVAGGVGTGLYRPAYVHAGEQLGETDFDDGKGLPWHIVESATGEMDFEIEDGVYRITIINPGGASNGGEDRWDCQFRHRGLTIKAGHTYKVHYEIKASNAGKYYTKIGNLAGDVEIWHNMSNGSDLGSTWDPIPYDTAGQWKVVELEFTAGQDMEVAEWAFHLGGDGQYTSGVCFPAGTVIEFDNMSLYDETSDENDYIEETPWVRSDILTNQVTYFTGMDKKATLLSASKSAVKFSVIDADGKEVWSGKSVPMGHDEDSNDDVHLLDFSDFNEKGRFTLKTDDGAVSREFAIGDSDTYSALLYDSLNYFYQNRSGIAIESQYITSGDANGLARAAGHPSDNAQIRTSFTDTATSGSQDVTGGWYDAGDHGKYVVNGGISLWVLQNQYETAVNTGMEAAYADGTMNIPENNNTYPDLLDEARWEMDWLQTMIVTDGEYKDMVYHKVHDDKWTGLGIAPADDTKERVIFPPTTAATLNVAACAAQAGRLWKGIDDAYAQQCIDVAERTYAAAKAHPDLYAPIGNLDGGGAYGDDEVSDEFYWAAAELYITTGDSAYYDDMKASKFFLDLPTTMGGGESVDTYGSFDWGHTAALGTLSVVLNKDAVPSGDFDKAKSAVLKAADTYCAKEDEQGYGLPYAQSTLSNTDSSKGYIWGSNSIVADNAIVISYAYILSEDAKYLNGAISAMDYLLGRNANDYSYVTGYGTHTAMYPHHRYWAHLIDESFPLAPNGVLVGGPNCGMEDPWVRGSGWKKGAIPAAKCYMDHIEAYSTNECTINWNAPLAWLTGFVTGNTDDGIILGAVNLSPAADPSSASKENTAAGQNADMGSVAADNGNGDASSDSGTGADNGNGKEKSGMPSWLIVLIIMAVVAVLISIEIFVYKLIQIKKEQNYVTLTEKEKEKAAQVKSDTHQIGGDESLPAEKYQDDDGLADIPPFTLSLDTVEENPVPEVQPAAEEPSYGIQEDNVSVTPISGAQNTADPMGAAATSEPSVQDIPASDYLYDAQGNPQMRILYDSKGNPVYVPLQK